MSFSDDLIQVSILWQSRRLYGCWPLKGAFFATVESKGNRNSKSHVIQMARAMLTVMRKGILPELSNFYCHPGKAGDSPFCNRAAFRLVQASVSLSISLLG